MLELFYSMVGSTLFLILYELLTYLRSSIGENIAYIICFILFTVSTLLLMNTNTFYLCFIALNMLLLLSYIKLKVNLNDFGNVPKKFHSYMLITASIAYICNLLHVYLISSSNKNINFKIAALSYYGLQLLFIPLVRLKNKVYVKILLFLCIFPITYIHSFSSSNFEILLSTICVLHVIFNDFLLFGYMVDS